MSWSQGGLSLISISHDRHLVHEVTSPHHTCSAVEEGLRLSGRRVRAPEKTLAVVDHNIGTIGCAVAASGIRERARVENGRTPASSGSNITTSSTGARALVHIIGPGRASRCPARPSAATAHLDPRRVRRARPRHRHLRGRACVATRPDPVQGQGRAPRRVDGALPPGVTAKDIILAIIGEIGTAGGTGT